MVALDLPDLLLLGDLVKKHARLDPDRIAMMVDGVGEISYRAIDSRSSALANGLLATGTKANARILLAFTEAELIDYVVAYIGSQKVAAVPILLPYPPMPADAEAIVQLTNPSGAICNPHAQLPQINGWRRDPQTLEHGQSGTEIQIPLTAQSLAHIEVTSGTTDTPKAVAVSHGNLAAQLIEAVTIETSGEGKLFTSAKAFPYQTVSGSPGFAHGLAHGVTSISLPSLDPFRFIAMVEELRPAAVFTTPALALRLVNSGDWKEKDLSSVSVLVMSGSPVPAALVPRLTEIFREAEILNAYSSTEASPAGTMSVCGLTPPPCVGQPGPTTEIRILGAADIELPPNKVGEINLRPLGIPLREYYGQPEESQGRFKDGWVRMGDLGYLDDEGNLFLVGRAQDIIVSGTRMVYASEVEDALRGHGRVTEAAVFGILDAELGEAVAAAVVPRSGVTEEELQRFVADRLTTYKAPAKIFFVETLPKNSNGKTQKLLLQKQLGLDVPQTK